MERCGAHARALNEPRKEAGVMHDRAGPHFGEALFIISLIGSRILLECNAKQDAMRCASRIPHVLQCVLYLYNNSTHMQKRYTSFLSIALLAIVLSPTLHAQWEWGVDLQVGNGLSRVDASYFMSSTEGFIGGNTGSISTGTSKILHTVNGGTTWTPVYTGTDGGSIIDIDFLNDLIGFATVGSYPGKILKTTDGGLNWTVVSNDSQWGGSELSLVNNQLGYGVGANLDGFTGMVRTTDGGDTWVEVDLSASGFEMSMDDVWFTSATVGYVVGGEYYGDGKIMKTTDGGSTWQALPYTGLIQFKGVYFRNASLGFAFGNIDNSFTGAMIRTTNGGATWTSCTFDASISKMHDVEFITDEVGYCISQNGSVFKTVDGGATWNVDHSGLPFITGAYTLSFADNAGYAFGGSSFFLKNASLTSIDERYVGAGFGMAPNPLHGNGLTIRLDDPSMAGVPMTIEVMNTLGTLVRAEQWTPYAPNDVHHLSFQEPLASGTYIVRLSSRTHAAAPRSLRLIVP